MPALLQIAGGWATTPMSALSPLQLRRLCRTSLLLTSQRAPSPTRMGLKMVRTHYASFQLKDECEESLHRLLSSIRFRSQVDGPCFYQQPVPSSVVARHGMPQVCTDIDAGKVTMARPRFDVELVLKCCLDGLLPTWISFPAMLSLSGPAHAEVLNHQINQIYGDIGDGLELGAQILYLAALLGLVGVASYFVVRQVLIRRDLESAARDLQDRVRTGEAMPVEYFELGAVMLRKKFYPLASKYLEQAIAKWDGDPQDLAQVHNALGFSYVNDNLLDRGIAEYLKAVKLQPGYVTAWNNLGSAYEKKKNLSKALEAYEQALRFDPNNEVAREYRDALKKRVARLEGIPVKNE